MITDENGQKWPETVEEAEKMQHSKEATERFFERKAKREGWAKPIHNQGVSIERESKPADRFFHNKGKREGWS